MTAQDLFEYGEAPSINGYQMQVTVGSTITVGPLSGIDSMVQPKS